MSPLLTVQVRRLTTATTQSAPRLRLAARSSPGASSTAEAEVGAADHLKLSPDKLPSQRADPPHTSRASAERMHPSGPHSNFGF